MAGESSSALRLSWTVAQGPFDSFLVQYRDRDGQLQTVSVAADQQEVIIEGLQPGRKYKFLLFGLTGEKRLGPVSALGVTGEEAVLPGGSRRPHVSEGKRTEWGDGWEGHPEPEESVCLPQVLRP